MQPINEDFLKFLCILKKRTDGSFVHYYNRKGNYWIQEEYLASYGFKNWQQVYEAGGDTLEGFVACQMRPTYQLLPNEKSGFLYVDANYNTPFDQWKFNLRHPPADCPVPDWVCIGEIKAECIRLLPKWAEHHLIYRGQGKCEKDMAVAALGDSSLTQTGGDTWAYGSSTVFQELRSNYTTYLHDRSTGFIRGEVSAYDHSRVELYHTGQAEAYGSATVILRPGSDGSLGKFVSYSPVVRAFRVKPGIIVVPGQPTADEDLIPIEFDSSPEPQPFAPKKSANEPFSNSMLNSSHGDSSHGDSSHGDSSHGDSSHGDSQPNSSHGDIPHGDSHGDHTDSGVGELALSSTWLTDKNLKTVEIS